MQGIGGNKIRSSDLCETLGETVTFQGRTVHVKLSHRIHVWYIYLHLVDFYGKCRWIYHTWILWVWEGFHELPKHPAKRVFFFRSNGRWFVGSSVGKVAVGWPNVFNVKRMVCWPSFTTKNSINISCPHVPVRNTIDIPLAVWKL